MRHVFKTAVNKKHILLLAGALLIALSFVKNVNAQVSYGGCRDIRGIPVVSIENNFIQDVAIASLDYYGRPKIEFNRNILASFALPTRWFWYGHECGHHARGHNFGMVHPMNVEQDADCFGIVTMVRNNRISLADVAVVESDLARLGPGDWTHLPGPRRAINLRQCLQNAGITTQSSRRGKRGSSKSRKARQTFGNICRVQRGACLLNQLSPVGRGCNCFSRFGPVPGIITNR